MLFFNFKQKKGQFWYIDILIGIFVIIVVAILFVRGIVDIVDREKDVRDLLGEGVDISNSITSKGLYEPVGNPNTRWCEGSNGRIGFVVDSKINDIKFNAFKDLVKIPRRTCQNPGGANIDGYRKSTILLGSNFDYVIYLQDKQGKVIGDVGAPYGKVYGADISASGTKIKENACIKTDNTPCSSESDRITIGDILNNIDSKDSPENKINIFRYVYYDTEPVDGKGELIRIGITVWEKK